MDAPQRKKVPSQTAISLKHSGRHDEIGGVYHELYEWAGARKVQVTGSGLTIFLQAPNEFDPNSGLFEVCLPVKAGAKGDGRIAVKELSGCTVASVVVKGPYSQIPAHYTELLAWLSAEGWEIAGAPREVYIKRPSRSGKPDPSQFVTEIQFPIKD